MASNSNSQSSEDLKKQWQREIASYIAHSSWSQYSHAAFDEAFKDSSVEILKRQAQLRRTVSCDSLPIATRTLEHIHSHGLQGSSSPLQKRPELRDVFENPTADLERLRNAMKKYESQVPDDLRTNVDFTSKHTWPEVMQAVEAVRNEHNSVKGFRDRFRQSCSKTITKHAKAILTWTEILPSQNEFLSPICGGLKLIFGAAAKLNDVQNEIYSALEQIPPALDHANRTLEMFKQHRLQAESPLFLCGTTLMSSILVTLNCVVNELRKKALRRLTIHCAELGMPHLLIKNSERAIGSMAKQDMYSESLSLAFATMNANAMQLRRAAEHSSTAALLDTHEKVDNLSSSMEKLREEERFRTEHAAYKANLIHGEVAEEKDLTKRMNRKLDDIMRSARNLESVTLSKKVVEATLMDLLPRFLESAERMDSRTGRVSEIGEEERRTEFENSAKHRRDLSAKILSSVFRYDPAVIETDTQKKAFAGALNKQAQGRAVALLQSIKLQTFMSKPSSSVLFANANCSLDSSPTAYVSAALASSIQQPSGRSTISQQDLMAFTFFCARHTDKYDPQAGPRGLMRSFISQLLSTYTPPLAYLRLAQEVDCEDIQDLCRLFGTLVHTLPETVVLFCIVDGITAYETRSAYKRDARVLMESLVQLVHEDEYGPVVKLWMSASSSSRNLRSLLSHEEIFTLQEGVSSTGTLAGSKVSLL